MVDVKEIIKRRSLNTNPTLALLQALAEFKTEASLQIEQAISKLENENREKFNTLVDEIKTEVKKDFPDFEKLVESFRGKDSKPEDVAKLLIKDKDFLQRIRPENGKSPTKEEIASILLEHLPGMIPDPIPGANGDHGKSPTKKELRTLILPLVEKYRPENGKSPTKLELKKLIKEVVGTTQTFILEGKKIAQELNKFEAIVDRKVIKDLDADFKALRASIRERNKGGGSGGGGMGNWVHERFNISSVTTSVTLRSKVAANGNAVLVRYQGQLLAHTVQYTISNNTVTLLFTPNDSTKLDVTYVRA